MSSPNPLTTRHPDLSQPPEILYGGLGIHGHESRSASYRVHGAWCLHWYAYSGQIGIGDWRGAIRSGSASLVPAGTPLHHQWPQKNSRHFFLHFRVNEISHQSQATLPLWYATLPESTSSLIKAAAEAFSIQPARARAALWEALHQMVAFASLGHPAATTAERITEAIHARLNGPISLKTISVEAGLSKNQVNRVFHTANGQTICAYWRVKKLQRAEYLIRATDLPVKHIAADLGYTDLQQFNKLFHRHFQTAPNHLRRESSCQRNLPLPMRAQHEHRASPFNAKQSTEFARMTSQEEGQIDSTFEMPA